MPYDAESQTHLDFVAGVMTYQSALTSDQRAHGFSDGTPAPPAFDTAHDERSSFAYASWYARLGSDHSIYLAGIRMPPTPPPLA